MKQNSNLNQAEPSVGSLAAKNNGIEEARKSVPTPYRAPAPRPAPEQKLDIWVTLDILAHRWYWLALGGIIFAGLFFYLGQNLIKEKFTATGQLRRTETPDFFKTAPTTPETFAALIRSPDLLNKVGALASPRISGEDFGKCLKVDPQPDSDMVKVLFQARDRQVAVKSLNDYMEAAVTFTRELQTEQAAKLSNDYLKEQCQKMSDDITSLQKQFRGLADPATNTAKGATNSSVPPAAHVPSPILAALKQQLQTASIQLNEALLQYKEAHPIVQATQERIRELQEQIARESTNSSSASALPYASLAAATVASTKGSGALDPEADIIRMKLLALEEANVQLVKNEREAELYAKNPPGMAVVFASATPKTVKSNMRWLKVGAASVLGGGFGILLSFMLIALVELTDTRIRTVDDVERVTRLPVLTTLGDLHRMDDGERAQWAFRAWTMLQGRLSPSANHGLVCGVTSSSGQEGRSTWIGLLAEAASLTGFRVLTIATKPSSAAEQEETVKAIAENVARDGGNGNGSMPLTTTNGHHAVAQNALATPSTVTDRLTGPESQPMVHIPLPGWVWNLDRRREWGNALDQWRQIDNLVILVELPPAEAPEAVLLGSNLPNLVWLADSGTAHAGDTRTQLQTLRDARCNLVGAVLNREPSIPIKRRFPRWLGCVAFCLGLGFSSAIAQGNPPAGTPAPEPGSAANVSDSPFPNTRTNLSFSIVRPSQRAAWQERLTLGPGDVLNIGLYGQPNLARVEVSIAPDGRLSFLEAQDVMANGLTVDELRGRLDQELGKYRRAPRTMITPVQFRSKRYYILGKVITKGVYVLDRPITVLEAIARAHGLENALVDRNVVDLVDFQRSFLARGGKRYPLDFEKLFQQGDLSQNIAIEPGDYIYFPPATVSEVYVVGEVRLPGTAIYKPDITIMSAIAARGGYTDRAYKARVLVVRGSINNPETFAVDTHAILDGRATNFKLQPRDIVYVNSRPFIKVEEIVDLAATAFIQSLITEWTGVRVVKPIP